MDRASTEPRPRVPTDVRGGRQYGGMTRTTEDPGEDRQGDSRGGAFN
ncbi:hypothetical protein BN2537_1371 [Streptomyces venezuelae]|nr:hypothetical protein BN2537_1371 [Streptomyces venezuelae]